MATKLHNRLLFCGEGYGCVQLVKRSVAKRLHDGYWTNPVTREYEWATFPYWRGQLVDSWEGERKETGERWGKFHRGQVIWLNADIFKLVTI